MDQDQLDNEAQEWANATSDFTADKGVESTDSGKSEDKGEDKPDDKTADQPDEKPTDDKAPAEDGAADTEPPTADNPEAAKSDEDTDKPEEKVEDKVEDNPTARDLRQVHRQYEDERKAVAEDIRKELYPDLKPELTDADGDPIRTVEDVMKLRNPNTQEPFTAEEAAIYLFQAQQNLEKTLAEAERKVEDIAEANLSLKDQSDSIRSKYGELLDTMPELQKQLWAEYEKTLERDPKTNIIIKAPVSLERFYDIALKPYEQLAAKLEADAEVETKAKQERDRRQTQADRSDIVATGKADISDPEEREWAEAAKNYYEG